MDSTFNEFFMRRCLELAAMGAGHAAPNPMVGAVLVHQQRIIGEGYHQQYGQAHAEVNCINSVAPEDKDLIGQATMYVSLEPCAHHGKTPPCADLIVAHRIPRVVIGCQDTFSKVAGKGIEKLKNAGIAVTTGVLEQECRYLNRRFFNFHEKKKPYVILKWAQTRNALMAADDGKPVRISNTYTDRLVHRWRSEEMSILVGTGTAIHDNPKLNTRLWPGKDPVRLVIDKALKVPHEYHVWDGSVPTIFISGRTGDTEGRSEIMQLDFYDDLLPQLLEQLYHKNITSVLVEGGPHVLEQFIEMDLWDECRIITGNGTLKGGKAAPVLTNALLAASSVIGTDRVDIYHRHAGGM